ncbi:MAG: hypothetical protein HYX78_02655 [Armatimonadetes bacterium]|nr:hypothetical protein [Armatimonadota bacterium]
MKSTVALIAIVGAVGLVTAVLAYPPAVGMLGKSKSCMTCHVNNGPWTDESKTIVDILDKETGKSLRQADGTFLIEAKRFRPKTVLTVIGRAKGDSSPPPYRNAWLYIDPAQIESGSLSKFAPGWSVDLPMSCRLVGDKVSAYEGASVTALPMTVRPLDGARNATVELHVMLTRGEAVKGDTKRGMVSNYLLRTVRLKVGGEE